MKYILFLLIGLSLLSCRGENDDEYTNTNKISQLVSSTTYQDLKFDVYRTSYDGYIVYETYYSHTQDALVYYFSYKLQLLDIRTAVDGTQTIVTVMESPIMTVDKPDTYRLYQGVSIATGRPDWYPIPNIMYSLTISDLQPKSVQ